MSIRHEQVLRILDAIHQVASGAHYTVRLHLNNGSTVHGMPKGGSPFFLRLEEATHEHAITPQLRHEQLVPIYVTIDAIVAIQGPIPQAT